jgi:iduronate 2-sulfatase
MKTIYFESVLAFTLSIVFFLPNFVGLTHAASTNADRPMNVLFVVSDDLNCYIGCYGDPIVQTPNLDRLAARGVRFDKAYCQFPVCNASRASFMTGMRPDHTEVYNNALFFRDVNPDVVTMPQLFKDNGYFAARVGKLYHYGVPKEIGTNGMDDDQSWTYRFNPCGRDKWEEEDVVTLVPGRYGATLSWLATEGTDLEQTDGIGATAAISIMEAKRKDPFFLAVGFYRPHTPYVAPQAYFDMYTPDQMTPPFTPEGDRYDMSPLAFFYKAEQRALPDETKRKARLAYAASISYMDAQFGRLLDALERLDLDDKTVVVFTSDHGYHMGEHHHWQKQALYEESARVPLIIAPPRCESAGTTSNAVCESIDIYPTLAELCGLPAPDHLDGVSLVPQIEEPELDGKGFALTQSLRYKNRRVGDGEKMLRDVHGYSLRTDRYRYMHWYGGPDTPWIVNDDLEVAPLALGEEDARAHAPKEPVFEALYDHETDPGEFTNLADDPEYLTVLQSLRDQLEALTPGRPEP